MKKTLESFGNLTIQSLGHLKTVNIKKLPQK